MKMILTIAIVALTLGGCASSHDKMASNNCRQPAGSSRLGDACATAKSFGSAYGNGDYNWVPSN